MMSHALLSTMLGFAIRRGCCATAFEHIKLGLIIHCNKVKI